uniref:phage tail protein n=1 Tax=Thaumasiovibrio occultus TaxID=1891184 RepID=UPI000B35BEFB|nr:phage tail protein [Thaumasiovibrio occultus]
MGGKKKKSVIGHRWYWGQHLVLCHGPVDVIKRIWFGEKVGFEQDITSNQRIYINKPTLFGEADKAGGVRGHVDMMFGDANQEQNDYLLAKCAKGGLLSAFRHLTSLVFRQTYMGNSSFPPPVAIEVERIQTGWDGNPMWYSEKADTGNGLNAAHLVHELIECPEWGAGNTNVDNAAFTHVADQLWNERFGLNIHWFRQQPVEDFIKDICRYINGHVFTDEITGKVTIRLARDDFDPNTLPVLNEQHIRTVRNAKRHTAADIVNTLTVTYTDPNTHEKAAITVVNSAMRAAVGRTIGETVNFPMIQDAALAYKVAMRELKLLSSRLLTAEVLCDTTAAHFQPGDVVKIEFPAAGLNHVMRVQKKRRGSMDKPETRLQVIEDVFSSTSGVFTPPPPSDWQVPLSEPQPVVRQLAMEAPYWALASTLKPSELASMSDDSGLLLWLAQRPTTDTQGVDLYFNNAGRWVFSHRAMFSPSSYLTQAIDAQATNAPVSDNVLQQAELPTVCALGDELVVVTSVANGMATLVRGVLDTHPTPHGNGAWIAALSPDGVEAEFINGESVQLRALTVTPLGTLPEAQSNVIQATVNARAIRPLPVNNVKFNNQYWPASATLPLNITWAHRNRLSQASYPEQLTTWFANGSPEPGTETQITIEDQNGVLIHQQQGAISSFTISTLDPSVDELIVRLRTRRSGRESLLDFIHRVKVIQTTSG